MAYNTVSIQKDVDGKPIPQYYNQLQNTYEVLQGRNGANRVELYDADGNAIDLAALFANIVLALGQVEIADSVLPSGAATESTLADIEALLASINSKDFATQTTLAAILAKIITAPATEAKQDTLISHVDTIETLITAISSTAGIKKITDALPAGTNNIGKVDINSSALPTGAATSAKQDTLKTAIDTVATLLTAIKNTTGIKKITDALPAGTNNIGKVTFDGSTKDLRGKAADKPAASSVDVGTTYWSIDTDPHADSVEVSNGIEWVVI